MIFTIKRASDSDSINDCALWQSPCNDARAISVLVQIHNYHSMKYEICPQPAQIHIIELNSPDDLVSLVKEVDRIIVYDSPYAATPGDKGNNSLWPESVRGLDSKPLDILDGAHGIIIYDDYME